MLVLGRKEKERIIIMDKNGKQIMIIRVEEINNKRVRLSFDADLSIRILREELGDKFDENRLQDYNENH